jgi:hypothetical protein
VFDPSGWRLALGHPEHGEARERRQYAQVDAIG